MVEEYIEDGPCYRCGATSNVRCDSCNRYMCPDHRVIYDDFQSYHGERTYCFDCAQKKAGPKKEGCFIATAAYGTAMCPELDLLRSFRDRRLKTNFLGIFLVKTYYAISPPIADFIRKRPLLRKAVRMALKPIINLLKR